MWDERVVRLFGILGEISPHSQCTINDLATEYEVSERTILRDIDALQRAKLGVFCDEMDRVKISRFGYKKIKSWMIG